MGHACGAGRGCVAAWLLGQLVPGGVWRGQPAVLAVVDVAHHPALGAREHVLLGAAPTSGRSMATTSGDRLMVHLPRRIFCAPTSTGLPSVHFQARSTRR